MSVSVIRQDGEGTWTFDACPIEDYSTEIDVTEHPIEDGSKVSDHAEEQPLEIEVEGYVSESPFSDDFKADVDNRVNEALSFFRGLSGKLLTITSQKLGSFSDCMLTGYPHQVNVSEGIVIRASFVQVIIAESERVELPPERPKPERASSVSDEQDVGSQPTKEDRQGKWDQAQSEGNGVYFY